MRNGKVYVGVVSNLGVADDCNTSDSIIIVSRWSGYRTGKQDVQLITDYKNHIKSETIVREVDIFSLKDFEESIFNDLQSAYGKHIKD